MTFGKAFRFAHSEALAFMIACPLFALIPLLAELGQHVIEMQIGMYDGPEAAKAAEANPLRMQFGFIKVLALSIIGYPVIRFIAGQRDRAAAHTIELRALALFALPLFFALVTAAIDLFFLRGNPAVSLGMFAASLALMPLLMRWIVAAPLGTWISPLRSIREMLPAWLWAAAFGIAVMLPLMIVHYALGIGAIFAPQWAKWPMLIADSFVVAWLAAVIVAGEWVAATRTGPMPGVAGEGALQHPS